MEWKIVSESLRSYQKSEYVVKNDVVFVGRDDTNDVVLPSDYVSRHHMVILNSGGDYFVEDRDSSNGTFILLGGDWEKVHGKKKVEIPFVIRAARDFQLLVSNNRSSGSTVGKTLHGGADSKVLLSKVYSIDELRSDCVMMVLDLCDSTRVASKDDRLAFHLKNRLDRISELALARYRASFVKSTGDGFLATFDTAADALMAAREILQALLQRNLQSKNPPIHIRIGLHRGKAYVMDASTKDIHGNDVNIVFRIEGLRPEAFREGGRNVPEHDRILCSRAFLDDDSISAFRTSFAFCGRAVLKGLEEDHDIYRYFDQDSDTNH